MCNGKLVLDIYTRKYLDKSWDWLTDPEIKKMTNTPDFTREEQELFFLSLPRENYKIWGLKYDDLEIGVVGLKNINDSSAEYFGYIGDKSYWCKGLSRLIFELIRVECVKNNITDIWLRVSRENIMAIKAYEKKWFCCFAREINSQYALYEWRS